MATTTGTVTYISVTDFFGCVNLNHAGGVSLMLLWSYSGNAPTAAERIVHNQYLSLVRDAFANNNTVQITHDTGSALATEVRIE